MTETQKRIKAYQKLLPELRERVIAVALLLAMSTSMLSSASFAWLTISRRPEVTNISTNIAANGNLEVALATGDGTKAPDESKEGDSAATDGQSVASANITWGNLINLADPSYGLENLTLRPAKLNTDDLEESPLIAAIYKQDGRISGTNDNFTYTSWVTPEVEGAEGYFGKATGLGVRGISSVKKEMTAFEETANVHKSLADALNDDAKNAYKAITANKDWMNALARMMGTHLTATMNSDEKYTNVEVTEADLKSLIAMYDALIDVYEIEAQALAHMINWQLYLAHGGDTTAYTSWQTEFAEGEEGTNPILLETAQWPTTTTADAALGINAGDLVVKTVQDGDTTKVVKLDNIKTFRTDYKMLKDDVAKMRTILAGTEYRWNASGLSKIVNNLVDTDKCLIKKKGESNYRTVSELKTYLLGNLVDAAMNWMNAEVFVKINNGVLYNLDKLVGAKIEISGMKISASIEKGISATANLTATIATDVEGDSDFKLMMDARKASLDTGADDDAGELVAQDTYGLAIDLWVRTNAPETYLTLEGNVLTQPNYDPVKTIDINGNQTNLHTFSRDVEIQVEDENGNPAYDEEGNLKTETVTRNYELYKIVTGTGENQITTWYQANTHDPFTLLEGEEEPKEKKVYNPIVIGYEGENRVWNQDSDTQISTDATTQGSGSCYIYYSSTPEDQARSMELLKSMHVAFIDADNELLAEATMDTANSFEDGGRTIVPLVLNKDSTTVEVNKEEVRTITQLEQNVPMLITAIVYLDGAELTNDKVLAAGDIQGQLNIQFGSSEPLTPIRDLNLESAVRTVSATVSPTEFDYDTQGDNMTSTVTLKVNGDRPNNVKGFFLRQISSTQGTPEEPIEFHYDTQTDSWIGTYTFKSPGTYVLRSVHVDGQEQLLGGDLPTVTIKGFGINSLSWGENGNYATVMSAESAYSTDVTVGFGGQKQPKTVEGRFVREDGGVVSVKFQLNSTTNLWEGRATFRSSGVYTLNMLVIDGDYVEVDSTRQKSMDITLGMYADITYYGQETSFKYTPGEMPSLLPMDVTIRDDNDNAMSGFTSAKLVYKNAAAQYMKMDTDLTWNGKRYSGNLKTEEHGGPGNWVFEEVEITIGKNVSHIRRAPGAPVFEIISPNEPSWAGMVTTVPYAVVPSGGASMQVNIKDSMTAAASAIINGQEIFGTIDGNTDKEGISKWKFPIPTSDRTGQNGTWTMSEVRVWNYFDKDGNYITRAKNDDGSWGEWTGGKTFTEAQHTMTVIHKVNVSFPKNEGNGDDNLIKEYTGGTFLTDREVSGVNVRFDIPGVTDIPDGVTFKVESLSYTYSDDETLKYGGYSVTSTDNLPYSLQAGEAFTMEFNNGVVESQDGKEYATVTQKTGNVKVKYAGVYTPYEMKFTIDGQPFPSIYQLEMGAPKITYETAAPRVQVSATSPSSTTDKAYVKHTGTRKVTVTYATYAAGKSADGTVANVCYTASVADYWIYSYVNLTQPTVTIEMSGMGGASTATLSFGSSARIYSEKAGTTISQFSWTGNGGCKRWIGSYTSATGMSESRTIAGSITADTLVLTDSNNTTYKVAANITINNPY